MPDIPVKRLSGRFGRGIDRWPDTPEKTATRRFSHGLEQLPDTHEKRTLGRFSRGTERHFQRALDPVSRQRLVVITDSLMAEMARPSQKSLSEPRGRQTSLANLAAESTSAAGRLDERSLLRLGRALISSEPLSALRALTALRSELDRFERYQVRRALQSGESLAAIGRALGISRQAANRRYRDRARP